MRSRADESGRGGEPIDRRTRGVVRGCRVARVLTLELLVPVRAFSTGVALCEDVWRLGCCGPGRASTLWRVRCVEARVMAAALPVW